MKSYRFNKLVRDKIIPMMAEEGVGVTRLDVDSHEQLIGFFKDKLLEEAKEVEAAIDRQELLEELADCLELVNCFAKALGSSFDEVDEIRKEKAVRKGGFDNGDIVDFITLPAEHHFAKYYQKNSDRYPELVH